MKRSFGLFVIVASLLCFVGSAQAVDPVKFMGLKAGKWNQYRVGDYCGNFLNDRGVKIATTAEGNFLWKNYEKQDGSWVHGDDYIFKVEPPNLVCSVSSTAMRPGCSLRQLASPESSRSSPLLSIKGRSSIKPHKRASPF